MIDVYAEIPDHEHTCAECVRFMTMVKDPGRHWCASVHGPTSVAPDRKACRMYWDRAKQEREKAEKAQRRERERQERWRQNEHNPPRTPKWKQDFDYVREKLTNPYPCCPNCGEPLFEELERCYYCGQAIEEDDRMSEWKRPPEIVWLDCFGCGGKGTMKCVVSKYNGHKHGTCTVCGVRFME